MRNVRRAKREIVILAMVCLYTFGARLFGQEPARSGFPANDYLFITVFANRSPNIGLFSINSFPTSQTPVPGVQEGSGTSGMVVDNDSASAQASSVYFGALSTTAGCGAGGTGGCAVKLTQAGLN